MVVTVTDGGTLRLVDPDAEDTDPTDSVICNGGAFERWWICC